MADDAAQAGSSDDTDKAQTQRPYDTAVYTHRSDSDRAEKGKSEYRLKLPTAGQLLALEFPLRKRLLAPWFREQESCMVYAATGVGKSLFALSAAMAIAGHGEFLGWTADEKEGGWRVLYLDGEMHAGDIQDRLRMLQNGWPALDKSAVAQNLSFLPRQLQNTGAQFPSITLQAGQQFVLDQVKERKLDLVVLDNFSTLGEVEDENAASSFNAIQEFLLRLKQQQVATMLVHHTGKAEDNFRGSSKLAATFEAIIQLEPLPAATSRATRAGSRPERASPGDAAFRVRWDKVRAGAKDAFRTVVAHLVQEVPEGAPGEPRATWEFETEALSRLDEMKEKLSGGDFVSQKEIADYYGHSKTTVRKDIDRGIKLGLWSEPDVDRWFAIGKRRRADGKTQAPVRPDGSWRSEALDDEDGSPEGAEKPFSF